MADEREQKPVRSKWMRYDLPTGETVEVRFERRYGYVQLVGIQIPEGEGGTLDGALLRRIPVGRLVYEAARGEDLWPIARKIRVGALPNLRRATPEERDRFYSEVAKQYLIAVEHSPRPASDIAAGLGISTRTVHGWVAEARRRGHLPSGVRGARR